MKDTMFGDDEPAEEDGEELRWSSMETAALDRPETYGIMRSDQSLAPLIVIKVEEDQAYLATPRASSAWAT